jgi:chorismate synthase
MKTNEETKFEIVGRHDPCIVPRALVVVEAMAAIGILDFLVIS